MTNAAFSTFDEGILQGEINLSTGVVKAAFVRGYTFNGAHKFVSDVTGAGGVINGTSAALTSKSFTGGVFSAANTTITTVASAVNHGLLLFQASAVGGGADVAQNAQRLIAYYDTGTNLPIQPGSADTPVTWDTGANKILHIG